MKKIILVFIILACFLLPKQVAESGSEHNISGWAWSENSGWISFNNTSGGGAISYGVNIDSETGIFSGYSWSENIGWISFADFDRDGDIDSDDKNISGSPCAPNCEALLNSETGKISGWARALAYNNDWDGWISLNNGSYEVLVDTETGDFSGWAWGSDIIGWISFNGASYKVVTSFTFNSAPIVSMSCDASNCAGGSCANPWISYRPTAEPTPCLFTIVNNSSDPDPEDIVTSVLYFNDVEKSRSTDYSNYTIPVSVVAGDYVVKLCVNDGVNPEECVTHDLDLREEVWADFMCSLDNENWESCETISLAEDEKLYLKDSITLTEHSTYSEGASFISSRVWQKGDGESFDEPFAIDDDNPFTALATDKKVIRLTVIDDQGRTDYQNHTISVSFPFPEWEEIAPF